MGVLIFVGAFTNLGDFVKLNTHKKD